ncbi:MAG: radical SAM protein [Candidatus Methanoperedens sp.]
MKVLLVNPPRFKGTPVVREIRCAGLSPISVYPPIKLAYTASMLEANNIEVKILDANAFDYSYEDVKKYIENYNPSVVIFTSSLTTISYDVLVAKLAKEINKDIITVLDDSHIAPVAPEKVLNKFGFVDVLIGGESEFTIMDLINNIDSLENVKGISYIKNGSFIRTENREPEDINLLPPPAYHLLPIDRYFSLTFARKKPFGTIITSVGCPFNCIFCIVGGSTVWRGYGKRWRAKKADKVLDEIEYLHKHFGIKSLYFFDETFTVDKNRVIEICKGIVERGIDIEWSCNSRVDTVNEEVLQHMKLAGCWNICYGVESGSELLLSNANKSTTAKKAKEIFKISKKLGLSASASFMIGLPGETWQTIEETLDFAKELDPSRAQFVITTPYPGTLLYEEVKKQGLIEQDYCFSGFDAYCVDSAPVSNTSNMSAGELLDAQKYIYKSFYMRPSYLIRILLRAKSLTEIYNLIKARRYVSE